MNILKNFMTKIPQVTLVALSGVNYQTKENIEAIRKSCEGIEFGAIKYIQDAKIKDIASWNEAVIYDLPKYVQTSHALFIHGVAYSDRGQPAGRTP